MRFKKAILLKIGIRKQEIGKEGEQSPPVHPKATSKKKVSMQLNLAQPVTDQVWSSVLKSSQGTWNKFLHHASSRSSYFHLLLFPHHFRHLLFRAEIAGTVTGGPLGWAGLCGARAGTGGFC